MIHWRWWLRCARARFHSLAPDRQRCARRGESWIGMEDKSALPDWWERRRWGYGPLRALNWWLHNGAPQRVCRKIYHALRARHCYRLAGHFNLYQGGNRWAHRWQPRTCSYCGGVHPEDAIRLIHEDWTISPTGKSYKWYMEPPGYREAMSAWREAHYRALDASGAPAFDQPRPAVWSPVPPVKLYVQHFDEAQIARFNAALDASRMDKEAA